MSRSSAYDKADWHSGGKYPVELPPENGGTHIGMFLAWAIMNHLEGELDLVGAEIELLKVRSRKMTGRAFLFQACDGTITEESLNDEGNEFASWYYESEQNGYGPYLGDYEASLAEKLPTLYHVADTWENFDGLAPVIDRRFAEWKLKKA
jgi:hypothetical protein